MKRKIFILLLALSLCITFLFALPSCDKKSESEYAPQIEKIFQTSYGDVCVEVSNYNNVEVSFDNGNNFYPVEKELNGVKILSYADSKFSSKKSHDKNVTFSAEATISVVVREKATKTCNPSSPSTAKSYTLKSPQSSDELYKFESVARNYEPTPEDGHRYGETKANFETELSIASKYLLAYNSTNASFTLATIDCYNIVQDGADVSYTKKMVPYANANSVEYISLKSSDTEYFNTGYPDMNAINKAVRDGTLSVNAVTDNRINLADLDFDSSNNTFILIRFKETSSTLASDFYTIQAQKPMNILNTFISNINFTDINTQTGTTFEYDHNNGTFDLNNIFQEPFLQHNYTNDVVNIPITNCTISVKNGQGQDSINEFTNATIGSYTITITYQNYTSVLNVRII